MYSLLEEIEAAKAMDFQAFYNMFQNLGLIINVEASMMWSSPQNLDSEKEGTHEEEE